jgi:hypothetical protein
MGADEVTEHGFEISQEGFEGFRIGRDLPSRAAAGGISQSLPNL